MENIIEGNMMTVVMVGECGRRLAQSPPLISDSTTPVDVCIPLSYLDILTETKPGSAIKLTFIDGDFFYCN